MNEKEIGRRIEGLRKAHGLSGQGFADLCGVTRESVRGWEDGKHLTLCNINKMVDVFKAKGEKDVENYLLFGVRRAEQIAGERGFSVFVNKTEKNILEIVRRTDPTVHARVVHMLEDVAANNPVVRAPLSKFKRK